MMRVGIERRSSFVGLVVAVVLVGGSLWWASSGLSDDPDENVPRQMSVDATADALDAVHVVSDRLALELQAQDFVLIAQNLDASHAEDVSARLQLILRAMPDDTCISVPLLRSKDWSCVQDGSCAELVRNPVEKAMVDPTVLDVIRTKRSKLVPVGESRWSILPRSAGDNVPFEVVNQALKEYNTRKLEHLVGVGCQRVLMVDGPAFIASMTRRARQRDYSVAVVYFVDDAPITGFRPEQLGADVRLVSLSWHQ
ncbi:MAG: hypothetical protein KC621_28785 [Myxococcales bacterium]|nr:hypothetical protein [Myxococcales bacterium]